MYTRDSSTSPATRVGAVRRLLATLLETNLAALAASIAACDVSTAAAAAVFSARLISGTITIVDRTAI